MSRALQTRNLALLLATAMLPGIGHSRADDPKDAAAYLDRGIALTQNKDYDRAIAEFSEAIRIDPEDATAYRWRGRIWSEKKEYEKAIADLTEAIRLDPKDAWAYQNRGHVWCARKDYDSAAADFDEAIRIDPKYALAYRNRGYARSQQKEYDKAIADLTEAIHLDPKDAWAYKSRGYAWNAKKDYDKAIADYTAAITLDPKDASAYVSRGIAWHYSGESYRAMADYVEAIRIDPKYAPAHHNLGLEVMRQGVLDLAHPEFTTLGLFDKAGAEFKETVRLDPKHLEARYYAGLCQWLGVRDGEAISGMKDFLKQGEWKGDRAVYATILGHFAAIRSGQPDEARRFLDEYQSKGDKTARLAPLVRYLWGEIDEKALMATSTDDGTLNALHSCLAIEGLLKDKLDEAKPHVIWYKEHGAGCYEFHISSAWLHRMQHPEGDDAKPKARPSPKPVAPDDDLPPVFVE